MFLSVKGHPGIAKQHSDNGVVKISAKEKLKIAIYIYPLVTKVNISITDAGGKVVETKTMDSAFIFQYFTDVPPGGGAYTKLYTWRPVVPDKWQPGAYTISLNVEGGIAGQKQDESGTFVVEVVAPKSPVIVDAKLFKKKKAYWTEIKLVNVQGSGKLVNKFVFEPTSGLQVTPIITTERGYHCASTGNTSECMTGKPLVEGKNVKFKVAVPFTSIKWTAYDPANNVVDAQTAKVRK